jgi:hypothetical protein
MVGEQRRVLSVLPVRLVRRRRWSRVPLKNNSAPILVLGCGSGRKRTTIMKKICPDDEMAAPR